MEHHSTVVTPVTKLVPVRHVPEGIQLPVTKYSLTQTLGLPVSPLNLIDIAFETPSHNGSKSGTGTSVEQEQGQAHPQFEDVKPDG